MACKLFLGGVPSSAGSEDVRAEFEKYGAIAEAIILEGKGFGFVTFEDPAAAADALRDAHTLQGQTITCKEAQGKGSGSKGGGGPGGGSEQKTKKIFVGGLPPDCSDEKVSQYFEYYGAIADCVVMKDRVTGRTRGFGYVTFEEEEAVNKVMDEYSDHKIDGKWVECKRSIPKNVMDAQQTPRNGGGRGGGGYGPPPMDSGYGCGGGYGPPPGYGAYGYGGYGPPPGYGAYGPPPGAYGGGGYGGPYGGYGGGGYGGGYGPPPGGGYGPRPGGDPYQRSSTNGKGRSGPY